MRWNKEREFVFLGALSLMSIFISAKLSCMIDWSWLWVLSPVWITGWGMATCYFIYWAMVG